MNWCIQNKYLKAQFQTKGAELVSLQYNNNELIWNANEPWKRHAPILFPIVGRLKNNSFSYNNIHYSLSQHGFARDIDWLCTYHDTENIEFELTDNDWTFQNYPFHFSLIVNYQLIQNILQITFTVFNPYHQSMYFSIGYHPAFYLPFKLNNYQLKFYPIQKEICASVLENGLISSRKNIIPLQNSVLTLSPYLFENDALIIENTDITNIELVNPQQPFYLNIHTGNAKNIGIWTKPHCNDFICIEPWWGIADYSEHNQNIEQKKDIIQLPPYQTWKCQMGIEIIN